VFSLKTVGIAFSVISRLKDIITWFKSEACFKLLGVGWGVKSLHWNLVNELFKGELGRDFAGFLLGVAIFVEKRRCGFTETVILVGN